MSRLVIRSQDRDVSLGFDLSEVLEALGPRVATSAWSIGRNLNYVSRDESDIAAFHRADLPGTELLAGLPNLLQIIDGEFRATDAEGQPWVTVRAIDSSWWEVISDDPTALDSIRTHFRNVREEA